MGSAGAIKAGEAFVRAFLDSTDVDKGLVRLRSKIVAWQATLSKVSSAAMGGDLPGPIGALLRFAASPAGGLTGLITASTLSAKMGNDILLLAEKAGIAVDQMSALVYAAKQFKIEANELALGLKNMSQVIDMAARGNMTLIVQLSRYGLNIRELRSLRPEDQFKRIAEAIAQMPNPTMRAAAAAALFGRWANELMPMLVQGGNAIDAWCERANELGIVIDKNTAVAGRQFIQIMNDAWEVCMAGVRVIGGALNPSLMMIMNGFIRATNVSREWLYTHQGLIQATLLGTGAFVAFGVAAKVLAIGLGIAAQAVQLFRFALDAVLLIPRAALSTAASVTATAWRAAASIVGVAWSITAVVATTAWTLATYAVLAAARIARTAWTVTNIAITASLRAIPAIAYSIGVALRMAFRAGQIALGAMTLAFNNLLILPELLTRLLVGASTMFVIGMARAVTVVANMVFGMAEIIGSTLAIAIPTALGIGFHAAAGAVMAFVTFVEGALASLSVFWPMVLIAGVAAAIAWIGVAVSKASIAASNAKADAAKAPANRPDATTASSSPSILTTVLDEVTNASRRVSDFFSGPFVDAASGAFTHIAKVTGIVTRRIAADWRGGLATLINDTQGAMKQIQASLSAGDWSSALTVGLELMKLEWLKFRAWLTKLWAEMKPTWNTAIEAAAVNISNMIGSLKNAWDTIWDSAVEGARVFLKAIDDGLNKVRDTVDVIMAFVNNLPGVNSSLHKSAAYEAIAEKNRLRDQGMSWEDIRKKVGQGDNEDDIDYMNRRGQEAVNKSTAPSPRGRPLDQILPKALTPEQKVQRSQDNTATGKNVGDLLRGLFANNNAQPPAAPNADDAAIAEQQAKLGKAKADAKVISDELIKKQKQPETKFPKGFEELPIQEGRHAAGTFSAAAAGMMGASSADPGVKATEKMSGIIEAKLDQIHSALKSQKAIQRAQMVEMIRGVA
jgi:hypothetical protein